jgi:putative Mg2+ transporter-C (MgtC) family protein
MEITDFVIRILVAMGAGMIIGLERQFHQKRAGLRTHTLVAIGSAVFVLTSFKVSGETGGDATRIIGQVVTGIGFLGAGVILRQGLSVHGLTTAATIWCSSAAGCLAASGYFLETAISTFVIVFVNIFLRRIDDKIESLNPDKRTKNINK